MPRVSNFFCFRVVCSQLGYTNANAVNTENSKVPWEQLAAEGFVWPPAPVLLVGPDCVGTESRLVDCRRQPWGTVDDRCYNLTVAMAVCYDDLTTATTPTTLTTTPGEPGRLPVRLSEGDRGRVEVFHDGRWGTVCDHSFDNNDAK